MPLLGQEITPRHPGPTGGMKAPLAHAGAGGDDGPGVGQDVFDGVLVVSQALDAWATWAAGECFAVSEGNPRNISVVSEGFIIFPPFG